MKKTLTYITIVMTALMAASYLISEPKHTGMSLKTVAKADDSLHRVSNALSRSATTVGRRTGLLFRTPQCAG